MTTLPYLLLFIISLGTDEEGLVVDDMKSLCSAEETHYGRATELLQ